MMGKGAATRMPTLLLAQVLSFIYLARDMASQAVSARARMSVSYEIFRLDSTYSLLTKMNDDPSWSGIDQDSIMACRAGVEQQGRAGTTAHEARA